MVWGHLGVLWRIQWGIGRDKGWNTAVSGSLHWLSRGQDAIWFTLPNCQNNYLHPKTAREINLLMLLEVSKDQESYGYVNIIILNGSLVPEQNWAGYITVVLENHVSFIITNLKGASEQEHACPMQAFEEESGFWVPRSLCACGWTNMHMLSKCSIIECHPTAQFLLMVTLNLKRSLSDDWWKCEIYT